MAEFEIRLANQNDLPRLIALDHSSLSDYVWQLDLRRESSQVTANFREVRLPRSITVQYPRDPSSLMNEWPPRDVLLAALREGNPIGYLCAREDHAFSIAWITDIVISPQDRRRGAGSALVVAMQARALERGVHRLIIEMQSKNQACIRLAQKFGFEFCGYNDQYYPTQDVTLFFGRVIK